MGSFLCRTGATSADYVTYVLPTCEVIEDLSPTALSERSDSASMSHFSVGSGLSTRHPYSSSEKSFMNELYGDDRWRYFNDS